jgi:metacaspase-1
MPGRALSIGVNSVDPSHYGSEKPLKSCENDAKAISSLTEKKGFVVKELLTKDATTNSVCSEITKASKELTKGDIFLCYVSSHGGQRPAEGPDNELDGFDETWCLYDAQLLDDQLYSLFTEFSDGVRILVISDSCHSGTVTKNADSNVNSYDTNIGKDGTQYKFLPTKEVNEIYDRNRDYYNKVVENINFRKAIYEVKASAILLSAVQDSQFAVAGGDGELSLFTKNLLNVWDDGKFNGNYDTFRYIITTQINQSNLTPNYYPFGRTDPIFETQNPFTI